MNHLSIRGAGRSIPWRPLVSAACLAAALLTSGPARAALVISEQSATVNAGDSGAFDVYLTNTGPNAVTVGGFNFEINAGSSAVTFTGATTGTTTATYVFGASSLFGPDIATSTGQTLDASDLSSAAGAGTIAAGTTVGLGHVLFTASAGGSGVIPITLSAFPLTSLSDEGGGNLAFTADQTATITIIPNTVIPEPSTVVPAMVAALAGLWKFRGTRRKSA